MAARATLRSLPVATNLPFDSYDYPEAALNLGTQGRAVVQLTVTAEGRVAECVVVHSSGDASLDRRTCQNFRDSGRFSPAIGADGEPTQAGIITSVLWRISGGGE